MTITRHGQSFELTGAADAVALVANARQFDQWLARLDPRFRIHGITVQAVDARYDGGLLFAKLRAEVTDASGQRIPGAVFLRGDASAVLIILRAEGRRWVVLTVQPRFPSGEFESTEIPAGMLDERGGPRATAAREVCEETGLTVAPDQLTFLGVFSPSSGGSDERIYLYLCELDMTTEQIAALHNASAGAHHEDERIRVIVVSLEELPAHTRDVKALLAYGAYRNLWRQPSTNETPAC